MTASLLLRVVLIAGLTAFASCRHQTAPPSPSEAPVVPGALPPLHGM
jgi:hypothetical protein